MNAMTAIRNAGAGLCCGAVAYAWLMQATPMTIALGFGAAVFAVLNCIGTKVP